MLGEKDDTYQVDSRDTLLAKLAKSFNDNLKSSGYDVEVEVLIWREPENPVIVNYQLVNRFTRQSLSPVLRSVSELGAIFNTLNIWIRIPRGNE